MEGKVFWVYLIISSVLVEEIRSSHDEGPAHDSVLGDYSLEPASGWPKEPIPLKVYNQVHNPACNKSAFVHPDLSLDIPDIIKKYGYNFELHKVHTEDGYILGVFRINGSKMSPARKGKIPVFINHGLMGNALSWLFLYENNSLAFKLANAGYDVYLGNARGNQYSQAHERLSVKSDDYWDFSFHELGYYDVPAVIDYVLNTTGHKDLYYIGHSLGTCQYLVAMSDRPEYGRKIRVGFLLSTAGMVDHVSSPMFRVLFSLFPPTHVAWKLALGNSMNQDSLSKLLESTCKTTSADCGACDNLVFELFGYNEFQNNVSIGNFFSRRYYDTTSTKVFAHVSQTINYKQFKHYDFGTVTQNNNLKYNSATPPDYPIHKITAPTIQFWGYSDLVTTPVDIKATTLKFSPGVIKENNRVQIKSFNHLDMLIANDVQKYVYNRIQYVMDNALYVENKNGDPLPPSSPTPSSPTPSYPRKNINYDLNWLISQLLMQI